MAVMFSPVLYPPLSPTNYMPVHTQTPYIAHGIVLIRNMSGIDVKASISTQADVGGNAGWFILPPAFRNNDDGRWNRLNHGWQTIAFTQDEANAGGERVGRYVDFTPNVTTYVTFRGFNHVEINRVPPP